MTPELDYYHEEDPQDDEADRTWLTWGTIYLLHFSAPLHHANHYMGFALNLERRLKQHREGRGSSLTKAVVAMGASLELVATWEGDRNMERSLKDRHNLRALCPRCKEQIRQRSRENMRKYRGKA